MSVTRVASVLCENSRQKSVLFVPMLSVSLLAPMSLLSMAAVSAQV